MPRTPAAKPAAKPQKSAPARKPAAKPGKAAPPKPSVSPAKAGTRPTPPTAGRSVGKSTAAAGRLPTTLPRDPLGAI